MFIIGVVGVLFTVYKYFRDPQEALDKRESINQKETDSKASLIAQQVQWEKEATEKRFQEMGVRIETAMSLAQNHIHTVDTKVENLNTTVAAMSNKITELATIINERIPKK